MRPRSLKQDSPSGSIDGHIWAVLCDLVDAAGRTDVRRFTRALTKTYEGLPVESTKWIFAYLRYIVRYVMAVQLGAELAADDLTAMAARLHPRFARLLQFDEIKLRNALLSAFDLRPDDGDLLPGEFIAIGSAAAGLVMDNPRKTMAELLPHLAKFVDDNRVQLRIALGLDTAPA